MIRMVSTMVGIIAIICSVIPTIAIANWLERWHVPGEANLFLQKLMPFDMYIGMASSLVI